jgi:uncharacterized membrane protein YgcG
MAREKATAEQALARLDLARNDAAKVLAACGAFADPAGLEEGDRLLAALRGRRSGPVDWVRLARDVQAVDASWRNVVAESRRRFREDQELRERERAMAAAAAARAATYHSAYSSIGSHSSGSSFSSGGHSAGGSFSSGGHSAGRGF